MRLSCLLVLSCLLFSGALGSSSRRSARRHVNLARSAGHKEIKEIGQSPAFSSVLPLPVKQLKKRCKARNTTGITSVSTSHSVGAPVNVAPSPTSQSQKAASPSPTTKNAPPPSPTTKNTPPPSPTTKKASPSPSPTTQKASPSPSPSPTTSHPPPAQPTSDPGSGSGGSLLQIIDNLVTGGAPGTADLTFFAPALGACGETNTEADLIVAVSFQLFDNYPGATANPNNNPVCNKKIKIQYQGKSLVVKVTDRCTGCQPPDLDMTPGGFSHFADQGVGRLHDATWDWCDDC